MVWPHQFHVCGFVIEFVEDLKLINVFIGIGVLFFTQHAANNSSSTLFHGRLYQLIAHSGHVAFIYTIEEPPRRDSIRFIANLINNPTWSRLFQAMIFNHNYW